MPSIERTQYRLELTKNLEVLKQVKRNKLWREDKDGPYYSVTFDGMEFKFRPGKYLTVGENVGKALLRSGRIIVGTDPLSDPEERIIEKTAELVLGEEPVDLRPKTVCGLCGVDQKTFPRLSRHLMTAHKDDPRMLETEEDEGEIGESGEVEKKTFTDDEISYGSDETVVSRRGKPVKKDKTDGADEQ